MGRVQSKRNSVGGVELVLVKDGVASRNQHRGRRNSEFLEVRFRVAEEPTTDGKVGGAGVEEFYGVFQRGVGVGEDLVDEHVLEREVIAGSRAARERKSDERRSAVRQAALRGTASLKGEIDRIQELEIVVVKAETLAAGIQTERGVSCALAGV